MFGKIRVAVVSVVLAALAFGGFSVALAASNPATAAIQAPSAASPLDTAAATGANWAMGKISALGSDNFTLTGPLGGLHVVYVNDQTLYFNREAQASNFAALQVGDRIFGAANVGPDGKAIAKLVIDLGAHKDTSTDYRGIGVAATVNSSVQSFTFVNRRGVERTFYADANTKITDKQGNVKTFADIQPGTRLAVHAEKRADGKWWALEIKIGKTVTPGATSTPTNSQS